MIFQREIDVNQEVARHVEEELRKWQLETGPIGKPRLPQGKRQCAVQQQHPSGTETYSQGMRIQMGEPVHTEVHLPQQMPFDPQEYQLTIKANNHFIAGNYRNYQEEVQQPYANDERTDQQTTRNYSINRNIAETY